MITAEQLYTGVADAFDVAARSPEDFGRYMLVSHQRREVWLSRLASASLRRQGFTTSCEHDDGVDGSIDIAFHRSASDPALTAVVEAKVYHCDGVSAETGQVTHLWNSHMDFLKRRHLELPLFQVLACVVYRRVSEGAAPAKLRARAAARRSAARCPERRFADFEADLWTEFGPFCEVWPAAANPAAPPGVWRADYFGNVVDVRAYVLPLRPSVTGAELWRAASRRIPVGNRLRCIRKLAARGMTGLEDDAAA